MLIFRDTSFQFNFTAKLPSAGRRQNFLLCKDFQAFDDGLVVMQNQEHHKGLVAFGTIDEHNIFHTLPAIDGQPVTWQLLRDRSINKRLSKAEADVIPFDDAPVFVPTQTMDRLYNEVIAKFGHTLVQIAAPPVGPLIVLPIGAVLEDGQVTVENFAV